MAVRVGLTRRIVRVTGRGGGAPPSSPPVNLTPPTITQSGRTLTCNPGTWQGADTLEIGWFRNVAAIPGATGLTYTGADTGWCANFQAGVIARNSAGASARVMSAALYVGLLDVLSVPAAAAFDLWRLRQAQTLCISVRRFSDNVAADIGFDPDGALNQTDLLAHVAGSDGLTPGWFDQSGAGNNASQGAASIQPRIVNAGNVYKFNNRPALQFLGGSSLIVENLPSATAGEIYVACSQTLQQGNCTVIGAVNSLTYLPIATSLNSSTNILRANGVNDPPNLMMYINGSASATTGTRGTMYDAISQAGGVVVRFSTAEIGPLSCNTIGVANAQFFLTGPMFAAYWFTSALSAEDRATVIRNLGSRCGITVA